MTARKAMAVAAAGTLPFAVTLLTMPFGRDQGIYGYTGARMLAGDVPYRDIFSFKPPLTAAIHAVALAVFGHSMTSVRALDVGWTLATAITLAFVGTRLWRSPAAGAVAGVAFSAIYCHFNYWTTGQTDGWATLPVALAIAAPAIDRRAAVFAGALLGGALLLKYTFIGFVPLILFLWWREHRRAAAGVLAGLAAVVAAAVATLWVAGGLGAFLQTQADVTLPYTGLDPRVAAPPGSGFEAISKNVMSIGVPWLVAGVAGSVGLVVTRLRARGSAVDAEANDDAIATVIGWWLASLLSLIVQKKFFQYHFLPVLAPLALGIGGVSVLVERLVAWRSGGFTRSMPPIAALALCGTVAMSPFPQRWTYLYQAVSGERPITAYWRSRSFVTPDTSLADNLAMAEWLQTNTQAGERVFLWSYEPIVYFLSDRQLVSRFLYHYPLVVPWGPPEYRTELIAALDAHPPAAIGVCDRDASPQVLGHPYTSWQTFERFPELAHWVKTHCVAGPRVARWHTFRCGGAK
jgi:hypothetical protein